MFLLYVVYALTCKVAIFELCHDDASCNASKLNVSISCVVQHRIPTDKQSVYAENYFYYDFYEQNYKQFATYDYVGLLTYKAKQKVVLPANVCEQCCTLNATAYNFRMAGRFFHLTMPVLHLALREHGNMFMTCWRLLFSQNTDIHQTIYTSDRIPRLYFNYWITRPAVMKEYADWITGLRNAIEHSENLELQECLYADPKYASKSSKFFMTRFGRYTMHPFVFERLLPVYLMSRNIKLVQLDEKRLARRL